MRFKRYLWTLASVAALLAMGGGATASAASAPAPKFITIGTLYAGSGNYATSSLPELAGLKFWISQVNAKGGVYVKAYHKKIKIRLVAYNDQSDPNTATTQYEQLITQDKVNILMSDFGSVLTAAAVTVAKEHKMVLFDPTGTGSSFFTPPSPYIVLTSLPTSAVWPDSFPRYLIALGKKRVAIVYATNDFDGAQDATLVAALEAHHITPVYNSGIDTATSNYTVIIHNMAQTHPDAVVEFGYPNNDIAFFQNLSASGVHFPFLFTIFPGQQLALLTRNVGAKALSDTFTYPTPPLLAYNKGVTYGLPLNAFTKAIKPQIKSAPNFLDIAGYQAGLVIQKTLETSKSLGQLDLRAAAGRIRFFTLDGQFKLAKSGAQLGELLPVAQLQPTKTGGVRPVIVYPRSVATGKAVVAH